MSLPHSCFHVRETLSKAIGRFLQSSFGVEPVVTGEVRQGEQDISEFGFDLVCVAGRESLVEFSQLFADLGA